MQHGFHAVQRHVRDRWRDDTPLRGAFMGREQLTLPDEAGFQPLFENDLVRWDVGQYPVMADFVKAAGDVRV